MVNHRVEVLSFCVDFIGCVGMVSGEPKLTLTLAGNINGNKKSLFCHTSSKRLNKERRLQNWSGGWISESKQVCLRYLCLLCPCLHQQGQPGLCVGGRAVEEQKDQQWWGNSRELEEICPIQVGGAWWSASTGAGGAGGILNWADFSHLWEAVETGGGPWWLEKGRYAHPSNKQKNSNGFTKCKSCLSNLIACYNWQDLKVETERSMSFMLASCSKAGLLSGDTDGRPRSACPVRRGWGRWAGSVWTRDGFGASNRPPVPTRSQWGATARLFLVVQGGRARNNEHKLKEEKRNFSWGQPSSGAGCPERLCCPSPWRLSRPDGTALCNLSWPQSCPALSRRSDWTLPEVPFNLNCPVILDLLSWLPPGTSSVYKSPWISSYKTYVPEIYFNMFLLFCATNSLCTVSPTLTSLLLHKPGI